MTAALQSDYLATIRERRERVVALTREGKSATDIASIVNVSERSVQRIRVAAGIAKHASAPMDDDELLTAAALLEDGCSYNEVGRTLGRKGATIARHFPGRGWPPGEGGRVACAIRWAKHRAQAAGYAL